MCKKKKQFGVFAGVHIQKKEGKSQVSDWVIGASVCHSKGLDFYL